METADRTTHIRLACEGDADALQRLLVEYHEPLQATVRDRIDPHVRHLLEPEDVLQEAYAAAFQDVQRCEFDGAAPFYKWLERIAINELINRQRSLRSKKRDVRRVVHASAAGSTSYPDLFDRVSAGDTTPSRNFARNEAMAALVSSLARLGSDQRTVIRLRFLEGRAVAEVARQTGKTEAAVHSLCRRGLQALRGSLVSITRFLTR